MREGRPFRCLVPLMALACLAAAPAAPTPKTPGVDEIVAKYVESRGGLKKIRSVQTLRQKGHATTGAGRNALVTRELKRPGRIRFEFTVQGVTAVFASDGKRGWQVSPFDEDMGPKPLPDEAVREALEQADIEGPLVDYKSKGHTIEMVGRETIGKYETYKLKVTLKSGDVRYDYLDVKTGRQVRTDSTRVVRGGPVQVETRFDDFSKSDGILFPHLIEVQAVGRPQSLRVVVDTIEVNPPLSDARFELSTPVKP